MATIRLRLPRTQGSRRAARIALYREGDSVQFVCDGIIVTGEILRRTPGFRGDDEFIVRESVSGIRFDLRPTDIL